MRKYEIMFIVKPTLPEDGIKSVVDRFKKVLTDNGASVTGETEMGSRELAYEINDFKSGYYYVLNVEADSDKAVSEFNRLAIIDGDVVRHLITKVGE